MAVLTPMLFFPLILLPLLSFLLLQRRRSKKLNLPPGPPKLPIIGNLHQLGNNPHRSLFELSKRHGPLMHLQLGSVPALVVSSSELAREVLKTQDLAFCGRVPLVTLQRFFYGCSGVATAPYGDSWRQLRKHYILELFSSKKLQSFRSTREDEVQMMLSSISSAAPTLVNLTDLMFALSNTIICRVAFGKNSHISYGEKSRFKWMLDEARFLMGDFFAEDYFPGSRWLDAATGKRRRLDRCARELDAFFREVIDEHLDARRQGGREEDMTDVLLRLHKEGLLSEEEVKGSIMDLFTAGTGTSSSTIIWTMTELMRNPSAMKKAQDEVRKLVGKKGKVEEIDIPKLQYLKWVVNETLRLHPPLPLLIPREVIQQCKINNYDVIPKTRVLVNVWAISREEDSWKDPNEFIPERFEGSSMDYKGQDFQFLPFGSGRRICPGIHFGIANVEAILANLLYTFDWGLPTGMQKEEIDLTEAPGIATHKKSRLSLVATRYI